MKKVFELIMFTLFSLKPVWIRAGGGVLSFLGTAELIGRIVW